MNRYDFENIQKSRISQGFFEKAKKKAKQKFEVGEISPTTGLQKQQDGSWAPPDKDKSSKVPNAFPEDVADKVKSIVGRGPKTKQIKKMNDLGLSPEQMVYASGGEIALSYCEHIHEDKGYEKKNKYSSANLNSIALQISPDSSIAQQAAKEKRKASRTSDRDVKKMMKMYRAKIKMVAMEMKKALIVYGTGGLGKSYNMMDVLENEMGMKQYNPEAHELGGSGYDFVIIKGKTGEKDIYQKLYEHNGKMIIFDDADEAVKASKSGTNPTTNLLKAALDTGKKTYVSHPNPDKTSKPVPGVEPDKNEMFQMPRTFNFTGTFAAITNLEPEQMPQPIIQSRALDMDLSMSREETVELMDAIANDMQMYDARGNEIDVPDATMDAAVDFIKQHAKDMPLGRLNARTLQNVAIIKYVSDMNGDVGLDWRDLAEDELFD